MDEQNNNNAPEVQEQDINCAADYQQRRNRRSNAPPAFDRSMYMVNSDSTTVGEVQAWSEEMSRVSVVQGSADVVAEMKALIATGIEPLLQGRDPKIVLKELMLIGQKFQLATNKVEGVASYQGTLAKITRGRHFKFLVQPVWKKTASGPGKTFTAHLIENLRDGSWRGVYNDMEVGAVKKSEEHAELGMDRLHRIVTAIRKSAGGKESLKADDPIGDFRQANGIARTSAENQRVATLRRDVDAAINMQMLKNAGIPVNNDIKTQVKAFAKKHGPFKSIHVGYLAQVRDNAVELASRIQAIINAPKGLPPRVQRGTADVNIDRFVQIIEIVDKAYQDGERREGLTLEIIKEAISKLVALKRSMATANNQ